MIPNDAMDRVCTAHEKQYYSKDLPFLSIAGTDTRELAGQIVT